MTEEEWLACTNSLKMFEFFRGKRIDPRLRRFAVECCRRVRHLLTDEEYRAAADAGEAFADDPQNEKSTIKVMASASILGWRRRCRYAATADPHRLRAQTAALGTCASYDWQAAFIAMREAAQAANPTNSDCCNSLELEYQAALLRCLFGNPFRPIAINPTWVTPSVTNLAKASYEQRALPSGELDNRRLSVLADALEDSGCDNQDILSHLRTPGPHVRGCWSLNLCLGRS